MASATSTEHGCAGRVGSSIAFHKGRDFDVREQLPQWRLRRDEVYKPCIGGDKVQTVKICLHDANLLRVATNLRTIALSRRASGPQPPIGRNVMRRAVVTICLVLSLGTVAVVWASDASQTQNPNSMEEFLSAFADATNELDIERAQSLFLPPDDSDQGKRRAFLIQEFEDDWQEAKAKGESKKIFFGEPEMQRVTFRTTMRVRGEPQAMPVEFTLQMTEEGFKIVAFKHLPSEQAPPE